MTNEEAFKDWLKFISVELTGMDLKIAEAAWQAAIAYMQEQSEPVATIHRGIAYWIGKEPPEGSNLYITPQRQQPLKRLSQLDVLKILNECAKSPYTNTQSSLGFANAIMDAMQEINK